MGRPTIMAQRVGKHDAAIAEIEEARYGLPVNMYLEVMHIAATTGKLREYDNDGTLTGVRDISPDQQIRAAQYLINKAMPDKAPLRVEATPELANDQIVKSPDMLTTEQLEQIAYSDEYQEAAPHLAPVNPHDDDADTTATPHAG